MKHWIDINGQYSSGEEVPPFCHEVPERPDDYAVFRGGQWIPGGNIKLEEIRERRDSLLSASDWTQLPDSPLSSEKKEEWATYRQELRDLPGAYAHSPFSAVFPVPPTLDS